mgnify:CR=1 FL=1
MRYSYKAIDVNGNEINGDLEAEKTEDVGTWLSDRGYIVVSITQSTLKSIVGNNHRYLRIHQKDMNFFLIQLSNLITAGCPLLMSLTALYKQVSNYQLRILLKDVKEKIESGKSFSEALKTHKEVFPSLFITMVEVGEVGGMLGEVLERYSHIYDTMYRLSKKIIQAMIYPLFLLVSSLIVVISLLVFVFPKFVEGTKRTGNELPGLTMLVLNISNFISNHYLLLIGIFVGIFFICKLIMSNAKCKQAVTEFVTDLPIIGDVLKQIQIALFARILGTLLRCGVPILTSLQAVEKALSNVVYKKAMGEIRECVSRGESLSQSIGKYRNIFPESIILMTDVGERSGNMGEMLEKAGNIYERDMEMALETAVSFIQPALVVFLAIFIVIIALSMYLPLFDIGKVVG